MKRKIFSFSFFLLLIFLINSTFYAQEAAVLKGTFVETLKSNYVEGMEYKLNISLPLDYNPEENLYPVLIYLDSWMTTGLMNDAYFMVGSTKLIIPVILVGISFDGGPEAFFYNRSRDYTPTYISPESLGEKAAMVPVSGGAKNFLMFIKQELIPYLESKYKINKNDMGILGYSLGGLFAAWVLSQEPELFKKYGICSPSLFWDNDIVLKELESLSSGTNAVIFISSNEVENPGIKEGIEKIKIIFDNKKNTELIIEEFMGEVHYSGVPASYTRALTRLYQNK